MATKVTVFQPGTAVVGTLVQVNTIGFRPTIVKTRWSVANFIVDAGPTRTTLMEGRGVALDNGKNYCWSAHRTDAADPYNTGSALWNTSCVVRQSGPTTTTGKLAIVRMLDDGFEYEILQQFTADMAVIVEAISGVEVDAIEITEPGATGVQTYTTPFRPTFVEVLGSGKTAFETTSADVEVCLGASYGAAADQNAVWANFEDSAAGTSNAAMYCRRTECLAIISDTAALVRARVEAFNDMDVELNWLERNGSRKFVLIVMTGRHFIAHGLTQTNLNPFTLTGMTWTPEAIEMVSAALTESTQDVVSTDVGNTQGFGFSDGFATGPTERAVIATRFNFDGNAGASREVYQHEFDEVYASISGAAPPLQLGLIDVSVAFTADTVTLVHDDADPSQFYFFLIVHGPPVIKARQRLVKYHHNTYVDRAEGRTVIHEAQGRELPMEEIQVDNYLFSAAFMLPTPVKRHSNIEENHLHYIETLAVRGGRLAVTVERESLFSSVMKRLGGG
ncbi:MAG TPA: hypothetical protein VJK02_05110 [Anaerolineales bacterium]|nr:hypothetical protein [Anaerolineales bacterium]